MRPEHQAQHCCANRVLCVRLSGPASHHPVGCLRTRAWSAGLLRLAAGSEEGTVYQLVNVFVTTLDDASPEELLSGPIRFCNGLHNNWASPPPDIRHL